MYRLCYLKGQARRRAECRSAIRHAPVAVHPPGRGGNAVPFNQASAPICRMCPWIASLDCDIMVPLQA
jgi:hypothetical protein